MGDGTGELQAALTSAELKIQDLQAQLLEQTEARQTLETEVEVEFLLAFSL
jgi:hypothetical protein